VKAAIILGRVVSQEQRKGPKRESLDAEQKKKNKSKTEKINQRADPWPKKKNKSVRPYATIPKNRTPRNPFSARGNRLKKR